MTDTNHETPTPKLDIVIPVYNEGEAIWPALDSFLDHVKTPFRVLICYDHDDDTTVTSLASYPRRGEVDIVLVKNRGKFAHGAVMTGFAESVAPYVLTFPADDSYNAPNIDPMVALADEGCAIVCASRFMKGGCMKGAPWLKGMLCRWGNFVLRHLGRIPTHDASNGLRLFARRVFEEIEIESDSGFCYSIELLAKTHRLRWRIGQTPAQWYERTQGTSRFRVLHWLPAYGRWFAYVFATTWLGRRSVKMVDRGGADNGDTTATPTQEGA